MECECVCWPGLCSLPALPESHFVLELKLPSSDLLHFPLLIQLRVRLGMGGRVAPNLLLRNEWALAS